MLLTSAVRSSSFRVLRQNNAGWVKLSWSSELYLQNKNFNRSLSLDQKICILRYELLMMLYERTLSCYITYSRLEFQLHCVFNSLYIYMQNESKGRTKLLENAIILLVSNIPF